MDIFMQDQLMDMESLGIVGLNSLLKNFIMIFQKDGEFVANVYMQNIQ